MASGKPESGKGVVCRAFLQPMKNHNFSSISMNHTSTIKKEWNSMENKRKQIYSMTIDQELVERAMKASQDKNFSQFVREAIEHYIKHLESLKKA
jgi:hypothetical protein